MTPDECDLASEARHGGRALTSNLAAYLLPLDNPSALVIRQVMDNGTREAWACLWRSHFDPADLGYARQWAQVRP